jgi:hypothetical protein
VIHQIGHIGRRQREVRRIIYAMPIHHRAVVVQAPDVAKFRQALRALAGHLAPNGRFYATFFTAPRGTTERFHERGGVTTYADRDAYHSDIADIWDEAKQDGWAIRVIGDWNHPRDQQVFELTWPY